MNQFRRRLGKFLLGRVHEKRHHAQKLGWVEAKLGHVFTPETADFPRQFLDHFVPYAGGDGAATSLGLDDFGFGVDQKPPRQSFLRGIDEFGKL